MITKDACGVPMENGIPPHVELRHNLVRVADHLDEKIISIFELQDQKQESVVGVRVRSVRMQMDGSPLLEVD